MMSGVIEHVCRAMAAIAQQGLSEKGDLCCASMNIESEICSEELIVTE
jgi:hypothetical protein